MTIYEILMIVAGAIGVAAWGISAVGKHETYAADKAKIAKTARRIDDFLKTQSDPEEFKQFMRDKDRISWLDRHDIMMLVRDIEDARRALESADSIMDIRQTITKETRRIVSEAIELQLPEIKRDLILHYVTKMSKLGEP